MTSHAELARKPTDPTQAAGAPAPHAALAAAPSVRALGETAQLLNARPALAAQHALSERLSSPRPIQRAAPSGPEAPVQRTLLYPEAEWDAGIQTMREFTEKDTALVNAAEPTQIPDLAQKLGQNFVKYKPGAPPDLTGQRINYLVGHVTFGNDGKDQLDPYWAGQGPAAIVNDLVAGNIEAGSALKILGCLGGVSLAPQIAAGLAGKGKRGISVIASADIVHATGVGIVSFPMKNPDAKGPLTPAYAARNNSGKKLAKNVIPPTRDELEKDRKLLATMQQAAREAIDKGADADKVKEQYLKDSAPLRDRIKNTLGSFVDVTHVHFDSIVEAFSKAYQTAPSHATPGSQGWHKFVDNDTRQNLTAEDERPDRPPPVVPVLAPQPNQAPLVAPQVALQQPVHAVQQQPPNPQVHHLPAVDATHDHPLM